MKDPKESSSISKGFRHVVPSILIFLGILALDQATKHAAFLFLPFGQSFSIFETGYLSLFLTLVMNTGAAWGLFALAPKVLFFVRIVVLVFLFWFWTRLKKGGAGLFISLILGGAVSNIFDTFFYGAVVDFIHFRIGWYDYPVFNVADCAVFVGTVGLLFTLPKKKSR